MGDHLHPLPHHPLPCRQSREARARSTTHSGGRSLTVVPASEPRTIELRGQAIPYLLKVSGRAHRVRLVIRAEGSLEVVIPRGVGQAVYEAMVREKERWIFATLERVAREQAPLPPLATGRQLPLAGRELTLVLQVDAGQKRQHTALRGDTLTLTLTSDDPQLARKVLEAWYRHQAPALFAARIECLNQTYALPFGRVSIKSQKSRWGSCSRLGNLNFNWRLLLAPLPVLDYVVVHELCHLKEMNHGTRFWQLVARACPDYPAHRRWLRQHGRELAF